MSENMPESKRVQAPEHSAVKAYKESLATKEDLERFAAKERTGTAVGAAVGFLAGILAVRLWKSRKT